MGVAGSGKTAFARRLLRDVHATYLDKDSLTDAFFPHTRDDPGYLALRPSLYAALYRIAEDNLAAGNSVLLDAPHVKEAQDPTWPGRLRDILARTGAALVVIRCYCGVETLRQRLLARRESRDSWKLEHWEEFLRQEPPRVELAFDHLDVDTERDLEENVQRALRYIASR